MAIQIETRIRLLYKYNVPGPPKVCKIVAQSHQKQPKRPLFCILWGSRQKYTCKYGQGPSKSWDLVHGGTSRKSMGLSSYLQLSLSTHISLG